MSAVRFLDIPPLEHYCGSWTVSRVDTMEVVGEFFSVRPLLRFNRSRVRIETTLQYLQRFNRSVENRTDRVTVVR